MVIVGMDTASNMFFLFITELLSPRYLKLALPAESWKPIICHQEVSAMIVILITEINSSDIPHLLHIAMEHAAC